VLCNQCSCLGRQATRASGHQALGAALSQHGSSTCRASALQMQAVQLTAVRKVLFGRMTSWQSYQAELYKLTLRTCFV
jgi:hypothetical protein